MSQVVIAKLQKAQQEMLPLLEFMSPLTDREFVERMLWLANELSDSEMQKAMLYSMISGNRGFSENTIELWIQHGNPPNEGKTHQAAARKWWKEIEEDRRRFSDSLSLIQSDASEARSVLGGTVMNALRDLALVPVIKWDGETSRTDIYYFSKNVATLCGFALMRLLDKQSQLGQALRRCKLDGCNRFFLSFPPPGGGPRPSYCPDTDHQLIAGRLTAKDRTQRWREKNAKARKAK